MPSLLSQDRPLEILLVEDNPGDARLVEASLQEGLDVGFDLHRVARLDEGIRRLGEGAVDLVLLDLNLPDASGLDTIRGIQSADGDKPVVVLTGLDDEETALQALREGVQDYLAKDRMDPGTLSRVVRYSLERHRTGRELERARRASSRLTAILEATPDFVALVEPEGEVQWVNGPGKELLGHDAGDDLGGQPIASFHPDWAAERIREEGIPRAREQGAWRGETALLTREGEEIPVSQILLAHRSQDDAVEYFSTVMRDVSEARQREEELRRSEERLGRVLETIVEGLCITDAEGRIVFANEGAEEILEVPVEGLVGRLATAEALSRGRWRRHAPDGGERAEEEMAVHRVLATGEPVHGVEHVLKRPDQPAKVVAVNGAPLKGAVGETEGVVLSLRDVTSQRKAEEELERKALYDRLTGLPNRFLFFDRLEQASARATREGDRFAVLFVDLDRFKAVNDSLGHAAGDRVLKQVADRIRKCFREEDTVARIGGDEFTVLLEGIEGREGLQEAVDRLMESLEPPHRVHGEEFRIPASVGIVFGEGREEPDHLVRRADRAMYHVKKEGGAGHHFFAPGDDEGDARRLQREARLRTGLREGEFALAYHPVVELATGEMRGVEALARWNHPERGLLMAGDFIDLAEETGLVIELGEQLLRRACRDAAAWQDDGSGGVPLFFNLSPRQLEWSGLVPAVSGVLEETGLPPGRLCFEVTERMVMRSSGRPEAVKELGVDLFIDDFGTGYSSLSYLRDLPVDGLKVDRSFVAGLGRGTSDEALVQTILTLGETLGLEVVAEGVEREEQAGRLRDLGCRLGQGFHFARPMDPEEVARWRAGKRPGGGTS